MTEINNRIDQIGITLGYALFAYNDGLISEEVMNLYRDTFAPEICQLFSRPLDDKELPKELSELMLGLDIGSVDIPTDVKLAGERAIADYKADKIYTALLQPKIEEARKELLKHIEENIFNLCEVCACKESKDWQALKE